MAAYYLNVFERRTDIRGHEMHCDGLQFSLAAACDEIAMMRDLGWTYVETIVRDPSVHPNEVRVMLFPATPHRLEVA